MAALPGGEVSLQTQTQTGGGRLQGRPRLLSADTGAGRSGKTSTCLSFVVGVVDMWSVCLHLVLSSSPLSSCPRALLVSNILSVPSVPASGLQSEDVSQLLHTDPGPAGGDRAAAGRPRRLHSGGDGHRPGDL